MHFILVNDVSFQLVLMAGLVAGCMNPPDWQAQDFQTRSQEADFIILGRVVGLTPMPEEGDPPMSLGFTAAIDVQCVYKTPTNDAGIASSITVTPVNFTMSCAKTVLSEERVYLVFLRKSAGSGDFMPDEVNREEAQFSPDAAKLEYLVATYGAGKDSRSPGCPKTDATGDGNSDGPVGGRNDSHILRGDGGVTQAPTNQHSPIKTDVTDPRNGSDKSMVMSIHVLVDVLTLKRHAWLGQSAGDDPTRGHCW
ncbi:uncharacterized protein LOC110985637 [Acanthaster planci]|uniref:Uncharacterized protein LOC110985637 n=1 Tax=Acanthaster planci TaxID=133434 RepID=A0A8B7ZBY7_ACAPL|nr:uncharacterized protein LOC110985637 [Acanthaster planci]